MKFTKRIFAIPIFLFFTNCTLKAQSLEIVEGIVEIAFTKDTTYGVTVYWEAKKEFQGQYFMGDASAINLIETFCGKLEGLKRFPEKRRSLFDLPQYQNQEKESDNYYMHYGGDIFIAPDGKIVLTFQMKAEVIKIEEQPCERYYFRSSFHCLVEREPIEYPIYLIVNVIEANSLDSASLKEKKLKPYPEKSFPKAVCD